jgi:hypothetical protein
MEMNLLMRRSAALLVALLLLAVAAVPAEATTVHRVFSASMGNAGFNGLVRITAYTNGTGHVDYALKNLRKGATYHVEIRHNSCSSLGSVVARIQAVTTGPLGKATLGRSIATSNMNLIWQGNWSSMLAIRIVSGTSIKCGNLVFPRASRVTVPAYGIDLPVVRAPSGYPYCNVAMYMGALNQPQEPGVTFLMAHARTGMFLPLLKQWQLNKGVNMIGKKVYVYTTNSRLSTYQIYAVQTMLSVQSAVSITAEQLWLQTSTGPHGTAAKLVVKAHRLSTVATTYRASHPTPHIVHCGF